MTKTALAVLVVLWAWPAEARQCPVTCPVTGQEPNIVLYDSAGCMCVPNFAETTYTELEVQGQQTAIRTDGPFDANPRLVPLGVCGHKALRARSCNAAGCGEWGIAFGGTFPPCGTPTIWESMP